MAVKKVEAFVRVNKLEAVKDALEEVGIFGLTCEQVKGYGRQQGRTEVYRGSTYALNLVPKMRIEVVVKDDEVETVVNAIVAVNRTGEIGDGKIFISEVLDAIRIRTGERGEAAVS